MGALLLAAACVVWEPPAHYHDAEEGRVDTVPPREPRVVSVSVERGRPGGCPEQRAGVTLGLRATDNRTPAEQMGWVITLVTGGPPVPPSTRMVTGRIALHWSEGEVDLAPID